MSNHRLLELMEELKQIGRKTGFISSSGGDSFNEEGNHIRAREIGKEIYELGEKKLVETNYGDDITGERLMAFVCNYLESDAVHYGYSGQLKFAWVDVCGWLP